MKVVEGDRDGVNIGDLFEVESYGVTIGDLVEVVEGDRVKRSDCVDVGDGFTDEWR